MADLPNPAEAITINNFRPGIRGHPPLCPWSLWVTLFHVALIGGLAELARRSRVSSVWSEELGARRPSTYAAGELGVRLDVPYRSVTDRERSIVLGGQPVRQPVTRSVVPYPT
jgi:hypothetical protein